jgi:hypothetical protein
MVTVQALVSTHKGDAIAHFFQVALLGKGMSIMSCLQMQAYGASINDQSCSLPGGKQCILVDGYHLLLDFKNDLPYLWCRKPTEAEISSLPHIITMNWDPKQYDITINEIKQFHDTSQVTMVRRLIGTQRLVWLCKIKISKLLVSIFAFFVVVENNFWWPILCEVLVVFLYNNSNNNEWGVHGWW